MLKNKNANELLYMALEAPKKEQERENADGCTGCAYITAEEWELPCSKCKRAAKDYWRPKA